MGQDVLPVKSQMAIGFLKKCGMDPFEKRLIATASLQGGAHGPL